MTNDYASSLPLELKLDIILRVADESYLTECINLMVISKAFYDPVCDVAYHTIIFDNMSMCSGFSALIASKPSTFFAYRTQALYAPSPQGGQFEDELWSEQCSLVWAEIIPKLPLLRYLEAFGHSSHTFTAQRAAFWTIGWMENLKSLTLDRLLIIFLIGLIRQHDAPVFRRLTYLKLFTSIEVAETTNILLQSEAFPEVSHLQLLVDQTLADRLAGSFVKLKVLILTIFGKLINKDSWIQALLAQSSNVFVVFWGRGELSLSTRLGMLEAFKDEANGEYTSLWNRAEREIATRV